MISIPYSKNKRYLTGIDWAISALDYSCKKNTGTGNLSQVVLELNGRLDQEKIKKLFVDYFLRFPVIGGHIARDFNYAPYWKYPLKALSLPWEFTYQQLDSDTIPIDILSKQVNVGFFKKNEHVGVAYINGKSKSWLAFCFDHCIFDARGAEMFLSGAQDHYINKEPAPVSALLIKAAGLDHWADKFRAGKTVNRLFIKLRSDKVAGLRLPENLKGISAKFQVINFSVLETQVIFDNAQNKSGYLLLMPYVIAAVLIPMARMFSSLKSGAGSYLVPVTMDTRPFLKAEKHTFFNHNSFLFFKLNPDKGFNQNLEDIKVQFYDQVKSGTMSAIKDASMLMRIAPRPWLNKFMSFSLRKQIASFCFANVGDSLFMHNDFMGLGIENIFHMPKVPVPPGIGIFCNQYEKKLNLVLSYLDTMISDQESLKVIEGIKNELLNPGN